MATNVLGLKTFSASDPVDYNEVNDNYTKIDNGVKTAMQGRAVYNLLDNSDFRNPVNQRGATSYTGSGYTIDRWRSWDSGFSMTASDGGIVVSGGMLTQYIEKSLNGIYTLAAMTSNGTLYLLTANMNDAMTYEGNLGMGAPTDGAQAVSIGPGTYLWAALYEGSYTSDTLPSYVPKGYAAELAECQRYYQQYNTNEMSAVGDSESGITYIRCPLRAPMRVAPSFVQSSVDMWTTYNETTNKTETFIFYSSNPQYVNLKCTSSSGSAYQLVIATNNTAIGFSADL